MIPSWRTQKFSSELFSRVVLTSGYQLARLVNPVQRHGRPGRCGRSAAGELEHHEVLAIGRHVVRTQWRANLEILAEKNLWLAGLESVFLHRVGHRHERRSVQVEQFVPALRPARLHAESGGDLPSASRPGKGHHINLDGAGF